jgi:uracil-DNA glycosylase
MPKTKQQQLDEVKQAILDDKICPELAVGATQLVFGDGSSEADIVFIGEAPGKKEDEQGLPFVGAAGKFLNEMLATIGLNRQDVYITNIVKYRPPENRDPLPHEKAAFLPYLHKQLAAIKPKLVVTLGRHSMEPFLPGLRISECHGMPKRIRVLAGGPGEKDTSQVLEASARKKRSTKQTLDGLKSASTGASDTAIVQEVRRYAEPSSATGRIDTWVVLPLFHPAAALYNGGLRQTLIDDFNKIPAILAKV